MGKGAKDYHFRQKIFLLAELHGNFMENGGRFADFIVNRPNYSLAISTTAGDYFVLIAVCTSVGLIKKFGEAIMSQTLEKFTCAGCSRSFNWKPELGGRRIRCKCGHSMTIPAGVGMPGLQFTASSDVSVHDRAQRNFPAGTVSRPFPKPSPKPSLKVPITVVPRVVKPVRVTVIPKPGTPIQLTEAPMGGPGLVKNPMPESAPPLEALDDEGLLAISELAADAEMAVVDESPIVEPAPIMPAMAIPRKTPASGIPLAYQRGPTARERQLTSLDTFIDKRRDIQVPIALLVIGAVLYLGYYAVHYNLGPSALAATSAGLAIVSAVEAALLIGFALLVAGPLGVSFGGAGTAILKLAAIAVLTDGIMAWVDGFIGRFVGQVGTGFLGTGALGLPVAILIYWFTLTYLFSMDSSDAYMVVAILSFFYRIVRYVLILLLLESILSWGGISKSAIAIPGMGNSVASSPVIDDVEEAKVQNTLHEARQYAQVMGRRAEAGYIEDLYKAGAANVWFQNTRDINGKGDPFQIVVELPSDAMARGKCYAIAKAYYMQNKNGDPNSLVDNGEPYMIFGLPGARMW
jgi:hypothetical protein